MTVRLLIGMIFLGVVIGATGCGSNRQVTGNSSSGHDAIGEKNASLRRSIDLIGIWLGRAVMDRDALRTHLESLADADERTRIEEMAKAFESVSIAMEFRPDSTMEVEVEILPTNAPPVRETTTGTWKVVTCDARSITVTCTEKYDGDRYEEQTLRYEIAEDQDHISTTVPVGEELRPFNPRFEFERCIETKTAEQPASGETLLR